MSFRAGDAGKCRDSNSDSVLSGKRYFGAKRCGGFLLDWDADG